MSNPLVASRIDRRKVTVGEMSASHSCPRALRFSALLLLAYGPCCVSSLEFTYVLVTDLLTFSDARTKCQTTYGGDLATFYQQSEAEFRKEWEEVINYALKPTFHAPVDLWIGLEKDKSTGSWYWVKDRLSAYSSTRQPMAYNNWAPGRPNNPQVEFCGTVANAGISAKWQFNDELCTKRLPFVCKVSRNSEEFLGFRVDVQGVPGLSIQDTPLSFTDAQKCLASFPNLADWDRVITYYIKPAFAKPTPLWIGLRKTSANGVWKWLDGSTPRSDTLLWAPGYPTNNPANLCASVAPDSVSPNFRWMDRPCSDKLPYLCNSGVRVWPTASQSRCQQLYDDCVKAFKKNSGCGYDTLTLQDCCRRERQQLTPADIMNIKNGGRKHQLRYTLAFFNEEFNEEMGAGDAVSTCIATEAGPRWIGGRPWWYRYRSRPY